MFQVKLGALIRCLSPFAAVTAFTLQERQYSRCWNTDVRTMLYWCIDVRCLVLPLQVISKLLNERSITPGNTVPKLHSSLLKQFIPLYTSNSRGASPKCSLQFYWHVQDPNCPNWLNNKACLDTFGHRGCRSLTIIMFCSFNLA